MKYLYITVKQTDGTEYPNPLKLSEAYIINQILKLPKVESIKVEIDECSKEEYKMMFN